jgi:hypothetical protein
MPQSGRSAAVVTFIRDEAARFRTADGPVLSRFAVFGFVWEAEYKSTSRGGTITGSARPEGKGTARETVSRRSAFLGEARYVIRDGPARVRWAASLKHV